MRYVFCFPIRKVSPYLKKNRAAKNALIVVQANCSPGKLLWHADTISEGYIAMGLTREAVLQGYFTLRDPE